jgi:hypothetical protein
MEVPNLLISTPVLDVGTSHYCNVHVFEVRTLPLLVSTTNLEIVIKVINIVRAIDWRVAVRQDYFIYVFIGIWCIGDVSIEWLHEFSDACVNTSLHDTL